MGAYIRHCGSHHIYCQWPWEPLLEGVAERQIVLATRDAAGRHNGSTSPM
jgi:hypothetical protein